MSTRQQTGPSFNIGLKTFDLSVARDNELVRLPEASSIVTLNVPSDATIRLGDQDAKPIDLNRIDQLNSPNGEPFGQVYISNPAGTGTLELLIGALGQIQASTDVIVDSIESINDTVDVSSRNGRNVGKIRLMDDSGGLIKTTNPLPTEQQSPVGVEDSGGTQVNPREQATYAGDYTTVDLNAATGPQTLYSPTNDAIVTGVHMANPGGTADVQLEVTDGTDTAVLDDPGAAGPIHFTDELRLGGGVDSVQVNLTTAEGSALTTTAYVATEEL